MLHVGLSLSVTELVADEALRVKHAGDAGSA